MKCTKCVFPVIDFKMVFYITNFNIFNLSRLLLNLNDY